MEQEYTTSIFYKVFYGLASVIAISFTVWVAVFDIGRHPEHHGIIALPILGIVGAVLTVINLLKRKVIVSNHSIQYISVWGSTEIINEDVKGFKVLDKRIVIYSNSGVNKIAIRDYSSISSELQLELNKRYVNLDKVGYQNNLKEIVSDTELGNTEEERMSAFKKTKRIALIYNCGGIAMFILGIIFTDFVLKNNLAKIPIVLYPAIGIVLLAFSKGLIKLVSGRNSAYGSLVVGTYASTITGMIMMVTHYDFVAYNDLCLPVLIMGIVILSVLWKYGYDRSENAVKGQIVMIILIAFLYAIPVVMVVNCELDLSPATVYTSKVLNRYIYHNNNRSYFHVVIETSDYTSLSSKDLHIDNDLYDRIESLQSVHVAVKHGLLRVPWIYIKE
jgi:hypothetical protein